MRELFDLQCDLFEDHGILITILSYKDHNGKDMFRGYFKDMKTGYIHNPTEIERDESGKTTSVKYLGVSDNYKSMLGWLVGEAHKYNIMKQ